MLTEWNDVVYVRLSFNIAKLPLAASALAFLSREDFHNIIARVSSRRFPLQSTPISLLNGTFIQISLCPFCCNLT